MIVVKLKGGLGNQMFQYAAGRALSHRIGTKLLLDASAFPDNNNREFGLGKFRINARVAEAEELTAWPEWKRKPCEWLQRVGISTNRYRELKNGFNSNWNSLDDGLGIEGYFQSEKYFSDARDVLLSDFQLVVPLESEALRLAEMAKNCDSIMLHVRRGDYISNPKAAAQMGLCDHEYYRKAVDKISSTVNNPQYFVFSDDLNWVRENMVLPGEPVYVSGHMDAPEIDIMLMAQCRHHIIANSSFSWWGAWLSQHAGGRVIAPQPWFAREDTIDRNIYCAHWDLIEK